MNSDYLQIPALKMPFPENVSPPLGDYIRRTSVPLDDLLAMEPGRTDDDGWYALYNSLPLLDAEKSNKLASKYNVSIVEGEVNGVPTYSVIPSNVPKHNENRLIIYLHGGAFVMGAGRSGLVEAILMAYYSETSVIAVDYRMPPSSPYPAALEDLISVWKALLETHDPKRLGLAGMSAGGNLVLALVQDAIAQKYPTPAAVIAATPWADMAGTGDSYALNESCDIMWSGALDWAGRQYARDLDLKDPRVSPIYGSFSGFPPTMVTAGTRDMFLSDAARCNQKLLEADVETQLLLLEGQRHGDHVASAFLATEEPLEIRFAWTQMAKFLARHLSV